MCIASISKYCVREVKSSQLMIFSTFYGSCISPDHCYIVMVCASFFVWLLMAQGISRYGEPGCSNSQHAIRWVVQGI